MANKVPVKAIFSGSDVSSLGEFATSDTIAASYINGVPTGSLALAGGTMTGDLILGDNVKLEVGSASGGDLQIYHDGSNSYISEAGTGSLYIRGQNAVALQNAGGETYLQGLTDAGVVINYDNATKLQTTATGITVTGTAVATTDTDTTNTGSVTLDFAAKQNFVLTLTGNVTLANPTTEQVGQSGFIAFIQDGTGSRTVALGTDYETPAAAGLTLTATASATDLVPYLVVASNRILLGTPQLAFA
jgi:hypothetical protein